MNNLYLLLAIAGGLILVGLVIQGFWQANRAQRMLEDKTEPSSYQGDGAPSDLEPVWDQAAEFNLGDMNEVNPIGLPDTRIHASIIDPLIDAVVVIQLDQPVSAEAALSAASTARRAGNKPMYFEGFNEAAQAWQLLQSGDQYSQIQVGLQLANRLGPLNEIEFSEFIMKMEGYAEALGGSFEAPDMIETVARARELDAFASEHDAQLSIYLVANKTAWSQSFLQQQAAAQGFVAGSVPGRMVISATQTGAPPMLTLQYDMQAAMSDDPNMNPISSVALTLDVPQTDRMEQPFKLMYKVAAGLSKSLDASVVDEQGVHLDAQAFDSIYQMLEQLHDQLEQRGLTAGSSAARRLFS